MLKPASLLASPGKERIISVVRGMSEDAGVNRAKSGGILYERAK
jgi:hypothetical protein